MKSEWSTEILDDYRKNPVRVVDKHGEDIAIIRIGQGVSKEAAIKNAELIAQAPTMRNVLYRVYVEVFDALSGHQCPTGHLELLKDIYNVLHPTKDATNA